MTAEVITAKDKNGIKEMPPNGRTLTSPQASGRLQQDNRLPY
jgi:hypothetical protein